VRNATPDGNSHPYDQDPAILRRLASLDGLRRTWAGKEDAPEADAAAQHALRLAAELFRMTADWALRYRVNLAGEDRRPTGGLGLSDPYSYDGILDRSSDLTALQGRRYVRDLLMSVGSDLMVPGDFIEALEALDHGQVSPSMEATGSGRLGLAALQARLTALSYIEYRFGQGIKKAVTSIEVAREFGVELESMKDWRADVARRLPRLFVERRLQQARADGKQYLLFGEDNEFHEMVRDEYDRLHGEEVLARAAYFYRKERNR
jgi:hypothetical protein